MTKRKDREFDDGFEDEPPFDEEELAFVRLHRRRDRRPATRPPNPFRETDTDRPIDRSRRRRGLAGPRARSTLERPNPATERES